MGTKIYKGSSLKECLNLACEELNTTEDKLKYTLLEEKKGFFKKTITISVETSDFNENDGTVAVENGSILIKNPKGGGKPATITVDKGIDLMVNGKMVNEKTEVLEEDKIAFIFEENKAERMLNIDISSDKLEAYITIKYIPLLRYKLVDSSAANEGILKKEVSEEMYPEAFTLEEVKNELQKVGVKFGIKNEEIVNYLKNKQDEKVLAAKGTPVIDDTDDVVNFKFQIPKRLQDYTDDDYESIDFKNINLISSVKKDDIIAERLPGTIGQDGVDIYGNVIKKKVGKKQSLKFGNGCALSDENHIIALINGRPSIKNNVISINEVYQVTGDVDIKTGNVKFIGDIKITGSVNEDMKVDSGGNIEIEQNVEHSEITSKGDIDIKGNVIFSKIIAGGEDVITHRRLNDLELFSTHIKNLIEAVEEIKKFGLLGNKNEDGEIIKLLLESKFRSIKEVIIRIIQDAKYDEEPEFDIVIPLIKQKLVGMAPLGIKHYGELLDIISAIKEKLAQLKTNLAIPVDVKISYCQDCNISSSGNIVILGKGEYVSNITANDSIAFTYDKGVARGGVLTAVKEIRCKTVGSSGGVSTKLVVGSEGHIWIDAAYQNTKLVIGTREYIFDIPSKQVHAYIDENKELIVDKLKL